MAGKPRSVHSKSLSCKLHPNDLYRTRDQIQFGDKEVGGFRVKHMQTNDKLTACPRCQFRV